MSDTTKKSESEKTYKVVINNCHGGFYLSSKAIDFMKNAKDNFDPSDRECLFTHRHDPDLVKMVETLGNEASGRCAKLEIQNVSGPYYIYEYDGREDAREPESIFWIDPKTDLA
jgi:hypothetical protein